jgi:REP element-mobilizing transposase RayT
VGRELRIVDTEAIYHVVARGNNKGLIVWDRHDCDTFAEELAAVATKYRWDVFTWCLMPNHHHVVLKAPQDGLSAGFQELNGNHSRRTNRRHDRMDHLFRNRFRWTPVLSDAHLIGTVLYVARNPLTAGLCGHAREWRYGSYRAIAGDELAPRWLVVDQVLRLFGPTPEQARLEFERLVHGGHLLVSDTERNAGAADTALLTI